MALIEIRKLSKLYLMGETTVRALDGVDLTIERGEFVAITGPSGSGKSTMMHLLGCLDVPTSGSYVLNGRDVSRFSHRELAAVRNREIGFVFQTFNLINRTTALDNVRVPLFYARRSATRAPALRALERVGLDQRGSHRPSELSGGERQRVAIARAIVNDPILLLADEPTGNLDTRTGEQIMEIFHNLNQQGVTIVLVTHEPDVAIQARRIVQMRDGRIVADRNTAEIMQEQGIAPAPTQIPTLTLPPSAAVANDAEAAAPPVAARPAAQLVRGATGSLVCGVLATCLAVVGVLGGSAVQAAHPGIDAAPTPQLMFNAALVMTGLLAALIFAIVAIVTGRRALSRVNKEPGAWLGTGRARVAMVLGWLTVVNFVLLFAISRAFR